MEIQHTGKDFELTDAIRDYAEDKFRKACTQLDGFQGIRLHLTYSLVGHSQHGDTQGLNAVLFVPSSEPLLVEEVTSSLYATIDAASKDLERQVRRYRDKHTDRQQRG